MVFENLYSASKSLCHNFSKTFCSVLKLQNHSIHSPSGVCHIHNRGLPLNTSYDPLHNHSRRTKDSPRTIASVLTLLRAYRWFIRVLPMIDEKDKRTLLLTKLFQTISFLAQNDIHFKKFSFSSVLVSIFDSVIHSKTGFISAFHSASLYPRLSISLTRYARRYWQAMYPFLNICWM